MHIDGGRPPQIGSTDEIALTGGIANRGNVVRVGNTVRRAQTSWSDATHALLLHLQDVDFDGAPRFLGVDSHGREVLSYIPGDVAVPPYPDWVLTDKALISVTRLIRAYHDAASTFDPSPYTWGPPIPPEFAGTLLTHNDLKPENVVFRDGEAVGLIDFDLASPGTRAWDIACAARQWAPLRPDDYIPDSRRTEKTQRFRLLVDTYGGLGTEDRGHVVDAVGANYRWFHHLIEQFASDGHPHFHELWTIKTQPHAALTTRWHHDNKQLLRAALITV